MIKRKCGGERCSYRRPSAQRGYVGFFTLTAFSSNVPADLTARVFIIGEIVP